MQKPQILSTPSQPPSAVIFDACHAGVVLRAVLGVHTALGVGTMFFTPTPLQWFTQLAWITGASLPATLAWLLLACSVKNALQHLPNALQYAVGVVLGAAAGLFACVSVMFCTFLPFV